MKIKMDLVNWKKFGRVLVCIDAANLENSAKGLGWWIDYKKLYQLFKKKTKLTEIRHYCVRFNNKRHENFLTVLKKAGFKLITKPLKIIKQPDIKKGDIRKANFDVEITVDTLKFIKSYKTLVLFSGDSDFEYLIKFLIKEKKKKVVVISTKHHISKELIQNCSFYMDFKKLRNLVQREKK